MIDNPVANPCGFLRWIGNLRFYVQCARPGVAVYRNGRGELIDVCEGHQAAADADGLGLVTPAPPDDLAAAVLAAMGARR